MDEKKVQIELSWASTDDLIEELQRRFPSSVFMGCRESLETKEQTDRFMQWHGNPLTVLGLLQITICRVQQWILQSSEEEDA